MKTTVYIGLGSNIGERQKNLQAAAVLLGWRVGKLVQQSALYESPSWGFTSTPFLNACLSMETTLSPEALLSVLKTIEKDLGRKNKTAMGYEDRTIDLDLLFYGDQISTTPELTVPHPQLHVRNFVLEPLVEIAPQFIHPKLGVSLPELFQKITPSTPIEKVVAAPWVPQLFTPSKQFVVIEGNIGSGKTTLTQKIATTFNVPALFENFSDNPHLAPFYENPKKHALAVETHFMEDRIRAYSSFFTSGMPQQGAVADYTFLKSLLFAQMNLGSKEFGILRDRFLKRASDLFLPDVLVYLHRPTDVLLDQIKKRGRSYEQGITSDYLDAITAQYQGFLEKVECPVLRIDLGAADFVSDQKEYELLLLQLMLA